MMYFVVRMELCIQKDIEVSMKEEFEAVLKQKELQNGEGDVK